MKKKILGKLTLGKRSIASLTPESMTQVLGGISVINGDDETCGCPGNTRRCPPPPTNYNCPNSFGCNYTDCCPPSINEVCNDSRPCP